VSQVGLFKPNEFGMGILACAFVIFWLSVAANLSYLGYQLLMKMGVLRGGRPRISQASLLTVGLSYITLLIQSAVVFAFVR
jgi:hypothetical protein